MPFRDSELNAFEEQIKAIKDSSSLLTIVCGTGVSMASVHEKLKEKISWPGLIQQGLEFAKALGLNVAEELNQIQTQEQKKALNADLLIELAGKVQKHLQEQDQYENWLQNNVGDAVLPDPNKMILINALADCAKISHVNLATTNYDYLLSRAQGWTPAMPEHPNSPISWQDRSGLTSWMQDRSERVLHLHGDAYNADSVIFSQADYDRLNKDGENGWTARIRSAISTTHVVLFIGCGNTTNDPAFKRILKLYEGTQAANRFNNKWFQLAKSDEHRFPRGIKKLTYGDEHDDLPIFVRDVLLPLLKTHLAKTETDKNQITKTVENNQTPLQETLEIPSLDPNALKNLAPLRHSVATIIHEQLNENKNKTLLELFENGKDINTVSMQCAQANSKDVQKLLEFLQKGFLNPNKYSTQGIKKIAGILVLLTILEEESLQIPEKVEEFLKINFPADIDTANFDLCLEILHSLHRHWPINLKLEKNKLTSESLVFRQEMEHPSGFDSDLHILNIALQIINEDPLSSGKNLKLQEIETVEQRIIDAGFDSKDAVNNLIERAIDLLQFRSSYKRGVIIDGRKGVYSASEVQEKLHNYFKSSKISLLVESDTDNQIKKIIRDFYNLLTPFLMSENNQNHE